MILIDVTQTSHTHAQTGVQRVCRGLYAALKRSKDFQVQPVLWDPILREWRTLFSDELETLEQGSSRSGIWKSRGAKWSLRQKLRSLLLKFIKTKQMAMHPKWDAATAFMVPEIFSERMPEAYAVARSKVSEGARLCAVFHDAMAVDHPEHTDPDSVRGFDVYLKTLNAHFDRIAPNSSFSKGALLKNFERLGVNVRPAVVEVLLGADPIQPMEQDGQSKASEAIVLSVGTIEGRKNHGALLDACETLWKEGIEFKLMLVGGVNQRTGANVLERIRELEHKGCPIEYKGSVSECTLLDCYARARFTVYPSVCEGFGLPVVESIQHGKPCITGTGGALRETGAGGGVVCLEAVDSASLQIALRKMLLDDLYYKTLKCEAEQRTVKSWDVYTRELLRL